MTANLRLERVAKRGEDRVIGTPVASLTSLGWNGAGAKIAIEFHNGATDENHRVVGDRDAVMTLITALIKDVASYDGYVAAAAAGKHGLLTAQEHREAEAKVLAEIQATLAARKLAGER